MSRKGIELGSITLHPDGLPHGPQPGKTEESIGAKGTNELAVMVDTFRPLLVSREALGARGRRRTSARGCDAVGRDARRGARAPRGPRRLRGPLPAGRRCRWRTAVGRVRAVAPRARGLDARALRACPRRGSPSSAAPPTRCCRTGGAGEPWRAQRAPGRRPARRLGARRRRSTRRARRARGGRQRSSSRPRRPEEAEAALDAAARRASRPSSRCRSTRELGAACSPCCAQRGARAKVRTGGVVPEAIPEPAALARFIAACAARRRCR